MEKNEWLRIPLPLYGGPRVAAASASPADPQVRAVQEPRGAVVAEGPQALLPLQGLHLREVHPHHRAAARHGRAGGAPPAAGQREPGEPHPRVPEDPAGHGPTRGGRGSRQQQQPGSEGRGGGARLGPEVERG